MSKIIIVLFLSFLSSFVQSRELNDYQAHTIYLLAHGMSKYPIPQTAPKIIVTSQKKIQHLFCNDEECDIHAHHYQDKIYLDEKLDMGVILNASILLREYVQFLQWANKGDAINCEDFTMRKLEAYAIQNEALIHSKEKPITVPIIDCK